MKIRVAGYEFPFPTAVLVIITACMVVHALVLPARRASTDEAVAGPIAALKADFDGRVRAMEAGLEAEMSNRAATGEPHEFLVREAEARHAEALRNYSLQFEAGVRSILAELPWIRILRAWGADPSRLSGMRSAAEFARFGLTLVTCQYLHDGFRHLASNMAFLLLFGIAVELRLGTVSFLALYTLGGCVATLTQFLHGSTTSICIGASGAIAAAMGAFLIAAPESRVSLGWLLGPLGFLFGRVPAAAFLLLFMLVQTAFGMREAAGGVVSGIAWFAHIGGFAAGCGWMLAIEALAYLRDQARS